MSEKKTLNEHLFDQLDRLSEATTETIDLELNRSASIISVADKVLDVARLKLSIIQSQVDIEKVFSEIDAPGTKPVAEIPAQPGEQEPAGPQFFEQEDEDEKVEYGGRMVSKRTLDQNRNKDKTHGVNSKYT